MQQDAQLYRTLQDFARQAYHEPLSMLQPTGCAMEEDLSITLTRLREEHRQLDDEIALLHDGPYCDQLLLQRMKKRKLCLKDSIARIESRLIPDLDA